MSKLTCFAYRFAVVFAQSIDARCQDENEDVVGAAPTVMLKLQYILVIDNLTAYKRASYVGALTVSVMPIGNQRLCLPAS